jgi:hypothetical protein
VLLVVLFSTLFSTLQQQRQSRGVSVQASWRKHTPHQHPRRSCAACAVCCVPSLLLCAGRVRRAPRLWRLWATWQTQPRTSRRATDQLVQALCNCCTPTRAA